MGCGGAQCGRGLVQHFLKLYACRWGCSLWLVEQTVVWMQDCYPSRHYSGLHKAQAALSGLAPPQTLLLIAASLLPPAGIMNFTNPGAISHNEVRRGGCWECLMSAFNELMPHVCIQ